MASKYSQIITKLGSRRVKLNEPLASYTTFKIGGPADLFYQTKTQEELIGAIKLAREYKIPYFILGGGSNILVSDEGFPGLVIKAVNADLRVVGNKIIAKAGTPTPLILSKALKNDLTGLEFLSGVPGTIGGAVACNARAYFLGKFLKKPTCVGDVLKKIVVLTPQGKFNQYSGSHYPHTLSESSIKKSGDVILSVVFELKKGVSQRAKQYLKDYESYRQDKPYRQYPTPGSIFQNPAGKSAGWLIDNCGLKGKIIGQAQISPQHANFIVNLGKAKAADVLALINLAKDQVKKKYRLTLKEEICFLGFDRI